MITLDPIFSFLVYLASGFACLFVFSFIYIWVTPYTEIRLIRTGNIAASISFGGAILGYAIPLARAVEQSASSIDLVIWAGLALVVQILVFWILHLILPMLSKRIKENGIAEAILLAFISMAAGMLNSASMSL